MSGQGTGWVLRHGPCTTWAVKHGVKKDRTGQAVLAAIADGSNRDGEHSHPGMAAMIDASGYSRSTVFAALDRLIGLGYIVVTEPGVGRGRVTEYAIPGVTDPGWRPNKKVWEPDASKARKGPKKGPAKGPAAGPIPRAKRSGKRAEKVQLTNSAPFYATGNYCEPGADAPRKGESSEGDPKVVADRLAKAEWERRKRAGTPTPVGGFVAFRTRIRETLEAGHRADAIADALPRMTTFTRGSFDFILGRVRVNFDDDDPLSLQGPERLPDLG